MVTVACDACGGDAPHDALRECASCLVMVCSNCREERDGEFTCVECAADAAVSEADDDALTVVLGEEES